MIAHNLEKLITHFALVDLKLLCSFIFKPNQLQLVLLATNFIVHSFFRGCNISANKQAPLPTKMRSDTYLSTFWPILKIYQVFGAFPIKKSIDKPCGFVAIQTSTYLVLVLSLILIGSVGQILSCYYIMRQYDQDLWSIMNVLFDLSGKYLIYILK